jgi:hypothetical protein
VYISNPQNSTRIRGKEDSKEGSGRETGKGDLRKLDIVLPEDPAIPLLGIYPEDFPTGKKDTCSTMFIAVLFIIARSSKDPDVLQQRIGYKNIVHLHNGVLISY